MAEDFFTGVEQIRASIGGQPGKLPCFYRDARSFTLVMPANLLALHRIMPDPRFVPAQVFPGIGAVTLTAFEYYDTDIGPYNELSIGVMLNADRFLAVPGYNMLRQLMQRSFDMYVHHLPVTTETALRGGIDLYNYPKFLASIEFEDSESWLTCELSQGDESICRLQGRKIGADRTDVVRNFCHLYQFQQPQSAEFKINARRSGFALGRHNAEIVLGQSHPVAHELAALLVSTTPLFYMYWPSMQAILYGPEHLSLTAIAMFLDEGMDVSLEDLAALLKGQQGRGAAEKPAGRKAAGRKATGRKPAGRKPAGKKAKSAVQAAIDEAVGTIPE